MSKIYSDKLSDSTEWGCRPRSILFIAVTLGQLAIIPYFFHVDTVSKILLVSFLLLLVFYRADKLLCTHKGFIGFSFSLMLLFLVSSSHVIDGLLLAYLLLLVVYVSALAICRDAAAQFNQFAKVYSLFILIVSVLGLYEYFSSLLLGVSRQQLIPNLLPANTGMRVAGVYGQPNLFALLLLTGLLIFWYQHLHNNNFSSTRFPKLKYLPFLTIAMVFFLTGSRAGLLALLLIFLSLCWLIVRKRYLADDPGTRKQFLLLSSVLLLAYGLSYLLGTAFVPPESARGFEVTGVSIEARFVFWTSAVLIFLDYPWFGVGLEKFKLYLPEYVNQAHDLLGFVQYESMGYTSWAHNEFLQLLCEGGIFVFLIVLFLLGYFFWQLLLFARGRKEWSELKLYSHLFLFPFIIQSMFSWPLRHPALLVLFATFLGFLLSQYSYRPLTLPAWGLWLIRGFILCGLVITLLVGIQEIKMGSFASNMDRENVQASFAEFEQLVAHPYSNLPLLIVITPRYVSSALKDGDILFAEKILPYIESLADLQGAHWQWYNLCQIYHLLGREKEARLAIERAINLWPTEGLYWSFQHYLNMLTAARETGRPFDDFLPIPPGGGSVEEMREIFNFDDRIKVDY